MTTIRKVAEIAGVSIATVSRTLAHPDRVRKETRDLVLEAVRAVGFVPNQQAVSFRQRSTKNVVLLVRDITNPFYLEIYRGIEELAFANGYRVLMGDARGDDTRVLRYVDMVRNRQADGLILMMGWLPAALTDANMPTTVVALEILADYDFPSVSVDNRKGARIAVEHLLSLGHRRIAYIGGPSRLMMSTDRYQGYVDALAAAGIAPEADLILEGDFHLASGRAAVRQLHDRHVDYTAIFCTNDEMAVGAVNELRALGLHVPTDVSVIGFDDVDFALSSDPPLTSVRQPRLEVGRRAMQMMVDLLAGKELSSRLHEADVELVVRSSTAPVNTKKA
ncbi:LacI family DNA-binding transcriptional regulator [Devosia sp. 2618]|uniref:LacI family DNA-binding transcriptional regulator n=1 Tax=Devosia sp. 2618 TaxID=3156454 RepID=UPI00339762A6